MVFAVIVQHFINSAHILAMCHLYKHLKSIYSFSNLYSPKWFVTTIAYSVTWASYYMFNTAPLYWPTYLNKSQSVTEDRTQREIFLASSI